MKKLSDFVPLTDFLWEKPEYDLEVFNKFGMESSEIKTLLGEIAEKMESLKKPWEGTEFEEVFRRFGDDHGLSASQIFQLIRVGISGQAVTPPLFESTQILGEEETVKRVKEAANFLTSHS
jgi:glutamyl-tRNA synthetase